MFKITLIKTDKRYNITPLVGTFSWDMDFSIMTEMQMEIAYSDTIFFPKNPCNLGDVVILTKDNEEIFRGTIVTEERTGRGPIKYIVRDFSWYLFESTTIYQFNNISASKAIESILNKFGIKIGSLPTMPTKIDKIYIEKSPAAIIGDIINKVEAHEGYTINAEMRQGKIHFEKREDLLIKGTFDLAGNIRHFDVANSISEPKRTRSIEDMRNRIRLIVDDEEVDYEVTALVEDRELINKYGLLEDTIKIDVEDAAKSRQVAKILLKRLGKIHETNEIKLMGDVRFKAGRLFDLKEPVTGVVGRFMIASVKHQVSNQLHTMELELVLPEDLR